jgi:hypothetical protein
MDTCHSRGLAHPSKFTAESNSNVLLHIPSKIHTGPAPHSATVYHFLDKKKQNTSNLDIVNMFNYLVITITFFTKYSVNV